MDVLIATGDLTITQAIATAVSAGVLLIGGWFAQRYGHGADTSLSAESFSRPSGALGLDIKVRVRCVGLRAIRITRDGKHLPTLIISEQKDEGRTFNSVKIDSVIASELIGQVAGPGESISWERLVPLRSAPSDTAGWLVVLNVSIRRKVRFWLFWTWTESVFVRNQAVDVRETSRSHWLCRLAKHLRN